MCKKAMKQNILDIIDWTTNNKQAICKHGVGKNMEDSIKNLGKPSTHKDRQYSKL